MADAVGRNGATPPWRLSAAWAVWSRTKDNEKLFSRPRRTASSADKSGPVNRLESGLPNAYDTTPITSASAVRNRLSNLTSVRIDRIIPLGANECSEELGICGDFTRTFWWLALAPSALMVNHEGRVGGMSKAGDSIRKALVQGNTNLKWRPPGRCPASRSPPDESARVAPMPILPPPEVFAFISCSFFRISFCTSYHALPRAFQVFRRLARAVAA